MIMLQIMPLRRPKGPRGKRAWRFQWGARPTGRRVYRVRNRKE
jgi:hypothetical protein